MAFFWLLIRPISAGSSPAGYSDAAVFVVASGFPAFNFRLGASGGGRQGGFIEGGKTNSGQEAGCTDFCHRFACQIWFGIINFFSGSFSQASVSQLAEH